MTAPVSSPVTTATPQIVIPINATSQHFTDVNGNPWVTYNVSISLNELYAANPSLDQLMCTLTNELRAVVLIDEGMSQINADTSVDTMGVVPTTVAPVV